MVPVESVQLSRIFPQAVMAGIPEKEPFQRILIIPLPELSEFTPHKGELFSGKGHLKEEKQPDSGKFLLIAAEHFVDQGLFAMHHLVVGYRKHIVLAEGVHHGKGQCGVQIFPAHRIAGHITKHIVCPAHVPFHGKAKSSLLYPSCDLWKGRGFFGNGQHIGKFPVYGGVQPFEKLNRL